MRYVWRCERRDARLNTPSAASPVSYAFTEDASGALVNNESSGFGSTFVIGSTPASAHELLGFPSTPPTGALAEQIAMRIWSSSAPSATQPFELVLEHFLRATVSEEAPEFVQAKASHERAVVGGLAMAYTRCGSVEGRVDGEPVVFFDDFEDEAFSKRVWSNGSEVYSGAGNGSLGVTDNNNNSSILLDRSFGEIRFTYYGLSSYESSMEVWLNGMTFRNSTGSQRLNLRFDRFGVYIGGVRVPGAFAPSGREGTIAFRILEGKVSVRQGDQHVGLVDSAIHAYDPSHGPTSLGFSSSSGSRTFIDNVRVDAP